MVYSLSRLKRQAPRHWQGSRHGLLTPWRILRIILKFANRAWRMNGFITWNQREKQAGILSVDHSSTARNPSTFSLFLWKRGSQWPRCFHRHSSLATSVQFSIANISNAKAPGRYTLERVLSEFDFIGILERLDESLVLLQLLLGLQVRDVLYLNAKQSGGYDPQHNCSVIPKTIMPSDVKEYLNK